MKDKRKIGIIVTIVVMLLTVFGITYAFINYTLLGNRNSVLVTGDIYMNYTESNQINLENAIPMTKDEALQLEKNIFNFQITGKNQSSKDIYYGISIVYGDNQDGKTRLKDEDIDVYLTSGEDVLINANRYKSLDDTRIWVEKINANTETYTKDYSLRMWVDESVIIGNQNADYTNEVWNNSYASFKVKVDGNLNEMNVPLEVDYQNSYYENGKTYFMVSISNYLNPSEAGISLASADIMKLDITTTNKDIVFTYQDEAGNKSEDGQSLTSISQTYTFEENKKVKMQVFVNSKNDIDIKTDINIKLSKNDEENYEILKYMHIKGSKDYCKNNGFMNFADCLLISEQLSNTVEEAKEGITKKGNPDLTKTAPEITYVATEEKPNATVTQYSGNLWAYADSTTFDTNNGTFTLSGNVKENQNLNDAMQGKWTCGSTVNNLKKCETVYHITSMEGNTIKSASSRTYQIANAIGSEVGLYKTVDNDGDTYYYRGDVQNNNVKFAGFYWKIIRVNGDGSVRLIYNGDHANATGMEASNVTGDSSAYNTRYADPAYVGYMYGESSLEVPNKSNEVNFADIQPATKYWFAKAYTSDSSKKTFKLTNADYQGTFSELNDTGKLADGYKYTCKLTSRDGECQFLIEIVKLNSATSIQAYYWNYASTSYENARLNTVSSNIKTSIENWYTTKLATATETGQTASQYINTGGTFCNDRSLTNGDGFSLTSYIYYGPYDRNYNKKTASLICPDVEHDLFSAKESVGKGNKKLNYPIGLITADEVALAGGLYNTKNERYYLSSEYTYWTMSPSFFAPGGASSNAWDVTETGMLFHSHYVTASYSARAVINLKSDVLLAGGNGTMDDPYTVKIAS